MSDKDYKCKTIAEVFDFYMNNRGLNLESKVDLIRMSDIFKSVWGRKKMKDLTGDHFNVYSKLRLSGKLGSRAPKSSGSIRREFQHFLAAANFCVKSKVLDPLDVPYIQLPPAPPPRDRFLSKKEIKLLKNNAVSFSRAETFIRIALGTGARKRSIETLKWSQIDFETGLIDFTDGLVMTKKRRSVVPMHKELQEYLLELKKINSEIEGDFVLENENPINQALTAACKRAGLEEVSPHTLRHTWATHASMSGVPLLEIARVLGDSIATVERVYAKFSPDYLRDTVEKAAL